MKSKPAYTVILWTLQFYWKFAVVIAITSVVSVTFSVWETRRVSWLAISIVILSIEPSSDHCLVFTFVTNELTYSLMLWRLELIK